MRAAVLTAAALLTALPARAADPATRASGARASSTVRVLEHHGRWESGYGETFYNVVGRLKNESDHPLAYVKLRVDAVDAHGKAVASTETYNESAEVLTIPEAKPADLLAAGKVKPLAAGTEERFRASFLKDEAPPFTDYRVTVIATPPTRRGRESGPP